MVYLAWIIGIEYFIGLIFFVLLWEYNAWIALVISPVLLPILLIGALFRWIREKLTGKSEIDRVKEMWEDA